MTYKEFCDFQAEIEVNGKVIFKGMDCTTYEYKKNEITYKLRVEDAGYSATIMWGDDNELYGNHGTKTVTDKHNDPHYYNVSIFYSRKDSFNRPIKTLEEISDADDMCNYVVEHNLMSKEDALQIDFIEEISKEEFLDMGGKDE